MLTRTSTSGSSDARTGPDRPGWISLHVFYAGDADPLLTEWVRPMLPQLRADGLVTGWFFVRYWLEGPHVRLRLRPAADVPADAVSATVEDDLSGFLARHPAPDLPVGGTQEQHRALFVAEYGRPAWNRLYGRSGTMPLRANNSYRKVDYEPEYARYGGPHGMRLSEWHFEASSDLVLRLLADGPITRTVRLGLSSRLVTPLVAVFLDDLMQMRAFLTSYRDFWEQTYLPGTDLHDEYDVAYHRVADRLRPQVERILTEVRHAAAREETAVAGWLAHCSTLKRRVTDLAVTGRYEPTAAADDPTVAVRALLPSYVHMTNNRLGVTVLEEAYLAHLLQAALADLMQ